MFETYPRHVREQNIKVLIHEHQRFVRSGSMTITGEFITYGAFIALSMAVVMAWTMVGANVDTSIVYSLVVNTGWYAMFLARTVYPFLVVFRHHLDPAVATTTTTLLVTREDVVSSSTRGRFAWIRRPVSSRRNLVVTCCVVIVVFTLADVVTRGIVWNDETIRREVEVTLNMAFHAVALVAIPWMLFQYVRVVEEARWTRINAAAASMSTGHGGGATIHNRLRFLTLPESSHHHHPTLAAASRGLGVATTSDAAATTTPRPAASPPRQDKDDDDDDDWMVAVLGGVARATRDHAFALDERGRISHQAAVAESSVIATHPSSSSSSASPRGSGVLVGVERTIFRLFYGQHSIVRTRRAIPVVLLVALFFSIVYIGLLVFETLYVSLIVGITLLAVSVLVLFVLHKLRNEAVFFDVGYVTLYATILAHVPVVLAPLVTFAVTSARGTPWVWALPILLVTTLQGYTYAMAWIVSIMTGPSIYPRFLFVGQFFNYAFWYTVPGISELSYSFIILVVVMNLKVVLEHGPIGIHARKVVSRWIRRRIVALCLSRVYHDDQAHADDDDDDDADDKLDDVAAATHGGDVDVDAANGGSESDDESSSNDECEYPTSFPHRRHPAVTRPLPLPPPHPPPVAAAAVDTPPMPPMLPRRPSLHRPSSSRGGSLGGSVGSAAAEAAIAITAAANDPHNARHNRRRRSMQRASHHPDESLSSSSSSTSSSPRESIYHHETTTTTRVIVEDDDDGDEMTPPPSSPPTLPTPLEPPIDHHHDDDDDVGVVNDTLNDDANGGGGGDVLIQVPTRNKEYRMNYNYHQRQILDIMYEARVMSQDMLADLTAMWVVPTLMWYLATYGSETTRHRFVVAHQEWLLIRYAIMASIRIASWWVLRRIMRRRLDRAKHRLMVWSVLGRAKRGYRGATVFRINLGIDSRLQRSFQTAVATYLQNRGVPVQDVPLNLLRYEHDLDLPVPDLAFSELTFLDYTVRNVRQCIPYFLVVVASVYLAIMASFDQSHRWALWHL